MLFQTVSFLAEVKIFSFWPKTMDYSQAFLPKLSSFFSVLLPLAGRCLEMDIFIVAYHGESLSVLATAVSSFEPLSHFIPLVEFKDRIDHWKWIGESEEGGREGGREGG